MIKEMRKNEKGFTLVELVVVIAILAILALLLVPRIMGNVKDSERSKDIANARTIASEIATHNALVSTDGGTRIGSDTTETKYHNDSGNESDLEPIGRDKKKDLPNEDHAVIVVDSGGNAWVEVKDED